MALEGADAVLRVRVLFCLEDTEGSLYACIVLQVLHFTLAICLESFMATMV
jgi:hypothetical protein